jgi:two-component system, chemotaxis family, CheB/CheR fusion protein
MHRKWTGPSTWMAFTEAHSSESRATSWPALISLMFPALFFDSLSYDLLCGLKTNNDRGKGFASVVFFWRVQMADDRVSPPPTPEQGFVVVGIGASAGGISPLREFVNSIPKDSGMAYVVILHLSPQHESNLVELLQSRSSIPVRQVTGTVEVQPNHVYVIPPIKYLVMMDGSIGLTEPERTRGAHTSIDLFFRTLAEAYGKNAIAILMSGTGADGTLGLGRIKEEGGIVIVQDPAEAEYPDMPRNAIETSLVDLVLPVAEMPSKLLSLRDGLRRLESSSSAEETQEELDQDALRELLMLLRVRTGNDFNHYKRPTLMRRVGRRMQVHGLGSVRSYLDFVHQHPDEVIGLMRDLLITVTNFFRDHEAFETLAREVVPKIFVGKGSEDLVRVWCAGCATGEEAYSLAILLTEYAQTLNDPPRIQVFATDIDERAIAEARESRYPQTIALDVSAERLRAFFTMEGDRYRIKKEVRETILFAPHNLLRDPPFSKLDLISCRNLLIYLNKQMQDRVLQILQFALRPDGYLFLGAAESAEGVPSLFSAVDKKGHVYIKRPQVGTAPMPNLLNGHWQVKIPEATSENGGNLISAGKLHQDVVEELASPSVLVNDNYEIIHMSTHAGRYMRLPGGEPTRDLFKLINPDLRLDLRSAMLEAKSLNADSATRFRRVKATLYGESRWLLLSVRRVNSVPERAQGWYLIMFDEGLEPSPIGGDSTQLPQLEVVRQLEQELQRTKDQLRITVEQYETSTEELRASNEELQAINEELRSATEELETSKEELQSVNEELTTVNQEYREKIDEVGRANSDLQNLMASTDIGTIFLDRALQIKRYTPRAQQLFNITPSDIGRPLEHFTNKLEYGLLTDDAEQVLRTLQTKEREVQSKDGEWYLARLVPYRTLEDRIDGIVLTFVEITRRMETEKQLRDQTVVLAEQAQILNLAPVFVLNLEHKILQWNVGSERLYGFSQQEAVGRNVHELLKTELPVPLEHIREALQKANHWEGELVHTTSSGSKIIVATHWIRHRRDLHQDSVIIQVNNDITARRVAEEALQEANRNKDHFLAMLGHELRNPLGAMRNGVELLGRANIDTTAIKARDIIRRQLGHLVRLVDDLLDVERLSQGKVSLRRERIQLDDVIHMALERCGPRADQDSRDIKLTIPDTSLTLFGDPVRLTQVFANLIENALKFTPAGGKIEVNAEHDGSTVNVKVKDTGIGMDPALLPNVFDLYRQGKHDSSTEQWGLGLGLALVKQLVEMHRGKVVAYSDGRGNGSVFTVSLPLAGEEDGRDVSTIAGREPQRTSPGKKKKVLTIEDNRDAADTMVLLLNGYGQDARAVYNGGSALETAREFKPDVAIIDVGLPGIDGFEVARQMRGILPQVVLIALSGWKIDPSEQRAKNFDHFITKPCDAQELARLISSL